MRFLPLVMVRMPVLPLERFRDLQPDSLDAAGRLWADARLRDAVRAANPEFARELDRRGAPDRRAAPALFRYANRMVTRPTPFGLFAGTGFASWGADGPSRAPRAVRRHDRVDAVAVGALVRGTRPEVVGRNPTARVSGTRVVA
ncbi:lantibiotic dehydratase, partial [Saccharothrix sp. NPDC042600]